MAIESTEEDILGLILADPDRYFEVAETLKPRHFRDRQCRAIYTAIEAIRASSSSFSLSMVEERAGLDEREITASAYLARLSVEAPFGVDVADLAEILIDRWHREEMGKIVPKLSEMVQNTNIPGEALSEEMCAAVERAVQDERPSDVYTAQDLVRRFGDRLVRAGQGEAPGIATGDTLLDHILGPMLPGQLIVIGGATSMGKSALSQQIARLVASNGHAVYLQSNEMSADEVNDRWVSQISGVSAERAISARTNAEEDDKIQEAIARLQGLPLYVDDRGKPTVSAIKLRAQRLIRQRQVRLVLIDHLQFVKSVKPRDKEFERISEVVSDLKAMAKALDVPVIAVSHVNRGGNGFDIRTAADIRRPSLSDLHGSSEIEKSADKVIFVHRPIYYLERCEPDKTSKHYEQWSVDKMMWQGQAELIRAKMRGGKGFTVRRVAYHDECTLFADMAGSLI